MHQVRLYTDPDTFCVLKIGHVDRSGWASQSLGEKVVDLHGALERESLHVNGPALEHLHQPQGLVLDAQ